MMNKCVPVVILFLLIFAANVNAQSVSATWALTANQSAETTGDVAASDQSLSNMQVSYSSSVQRSSPSGTAGTWPGESAENGARYMQFEISPSANIDFTASFISLKLYVNSGSEMKANVYYSTDPTFTTKVQIGSTYSLSSSAPASPNVTTNPNLVVSSGQTLYLRIYPWYGNATTGKYVITNNVTISGTTVNTIAPAITVSTLSLPDFGALVFGNITPASGYSVSGINLASDITVAAPSGFEVSKDSASFSSSVSLVQAGGNVSSTKIYARFAPGSAAGTMSGSITHASSGAITKNVSVTGIALAGAPSTQSAVAIGTVTGSSITLSLSGGNGSHRIIVARKDAAVSFAPTDGNVFAEADSNFSAAADLGGGNKIIFNGSGVTVTVTGLTAGTHYYFASYEYNIGEAGSQNYHSSNPGTANTMTLETPGLEVNNAVLNFGNVVAGSSKEKSYTLSGKFLDPPSGTITIAAPAGFEVSTASGSGFSSSINVPYSASTLASTSIFVRFSPVNEMQYTGNITHSGGGAADIGVAVSGAGVSPESLPDSIPFGFASLGGGTTGGKGGDTVIIISAQQLADIMALREKTGDPRNPVVLMLSGTLTGYSTQISVKRTGNVSIIGLGNDAGFLGFGMKIVDCNNIIVRNLTIADAKVDEKDALSVDGSSNVWVDHCTFTDSPSVDVSGSSHDGLLDVKNGSYNVTLSYNYFENHRKTCLLGHTSGQTSDTSMKVTYYRNWFNGTYSRHPRIRFAKAHIINNLYTNVGVLGADQGGYGVGITCNAQVMVEANYFEGTPTPVLISQVNDPGGTLSGDPTGYINAVDNYLTGSGTVAENTSGFNFDPSAYYAYTAADAQQVKATVQARAGAGKMDSVAVIIPSVALSTKAINFGNVSQGIGKKDSVKVSNNGTAMLNITAVSSTDSLFAYTPASVSIAPSSFAYMTITFTPMDASNRSGYIILIHNAASSPDSIAVTGSGYGPDAVALEQKLPTEFGLSQNYPNPFNPATEIRYQIPEISRVVLKIYDVMGREVATLANEQKLPGNYTTTWNAGSFTSGIYFCRLQSAQGSVVKKMMLIK